ncbi:MAG TPA: glycosyltransferase family 4 protein [Kineosporiaceae bacterium]
MSDRAAAASVPVPASVPASVPTSVHVVLPGGVDDPATPSGGNRYDRRVVEELAALGWSVRVGAVPGSWPRPGPGALEALAAELAAVPDGAAVLLDGLVAAAAPEVVVPAAARVRAVVLSHLPLGDETGLGPDQVARRRAAERRTLRAADAVIATSAAAARRLLALHGLDGDRVHVVPPGVDHAPATTPSDDGARLLCVASITPRKGHDVLVPALGSVRDLAWRCTCVGATHLDPTHAARVRSTADALGLADRVTFPGPRTGAALTRLYAQADLLVLPSLAEPFGMVVTEALASGVPVVASAVGGIPEALGHAPDGAVPGLLVPPGDADSLAAALRAWLTERPLRDRLRTAAAGRRDVLPGWDETAARLAAVLTSVLATEGDPRRTAAAGAPARFSRRWLDLREQADARARSDTLARQAAAALTRCPGPGPHSGSVPGPDHRTGAPHRHVVHDLGCGTGSMGRWLAPRLPGPQHWVLRDQDPDLLAHAATALPGHGRDGAAVTRSSWQGDVSTVTAADLAGACLVTASALLDLLTESEVDAIAAACVGAGVTALLTLSVSGRVELTPAEPLDAAVVTAFNAHQRRMVGGRHLLGPDAVPAAVQAFTARGARVRTRPAPWRLGPGQADLAGEWLRGWVGAAAESDPALELDAYLRRRLAQVRDGALDVVLHHQDLLAVPTGADPGRPPPEGSC